MGAALKPFIERWRIRHMDVWDQDYVDLVVPGYIEIEPDGQGSFQFRNCFWRSGRVTSRNVAPFRRLQINDSRNTESTRPMPLCLP